MTRLYLDPLTYQSLTFPKAGSNYGIYHPRGLNPSDNIKSYEPQKGRISSKGNSTIDHRNDPVSDKLTNLWPKTSVNDFAIIVMASSYLTNSKSYESTTNFLLNNLGAWDNGHTYDGDSLFIFEMKLFPVQIEFYVNPQGKITEISRYNQSTGDDVAIPIDYTGMLYAMCQVYMNYKKLNFGNIDDDNNGVWETAQKIGELGNEDLIQNVGFDQVTSDESILASTVTSWKELLSTNSSTSTKIKTLAQTSLNENSYSKLNKIDKSNRTTSSIKVNDSPNDRKFSNQSKKNDSTINSNVEEHKQLDNSNNKDQDNFEELYPSTDIPFFSLKNLFPISKINSLGCIGRLNYLLVNTFSIGLCFLTINIISLLLDILGIHIEPDIATLIVFLISLPVSYICLAACVRRIHDLGYSGTLIILVIILSLIPILGLIIFCILLLLPGASYYQSKCNRDKLEKNKYYMTHYTKNKDITDDNFEELYPSPKIPFLSLNNLFIPWGCSGRLNYFGIYLLSTLLFFIVLSLLIYIVNLIDPLRVNDFSDFIIPIILTPYCYINVVNFIRRLNDLGFGLLPLQQKFSVARRVAYSIFATIIYMSPILASKPYYFGIFGLILLLVSGATDYQSKHNKTKLEKNKYYMAYYARTENKDNNLSNYSEQQINTNHNIKNIPIEVYAIITSVIVILFISEFSL